MHRFSQESAARHPTARKRTLPSDSCGSGAVAQANPSAGGQKRSSGSLKSAPHSGHSESLAQRNTEIGSASPRVLTSGLDTFLLPAILNAQYRICRRAPADCLNRIAPSLNRRKAGPPWWHRKCRGICSVPIAMKVRTPSGPGQAFWRPAACRRVFRASAKAGSPSPRVFQYHPRDPPQHASASEPRLSDLPRSHPSGVSASQNVDLLSPVVILGLRKSRRDLRGALGEVVGQESSGKLLGRTSSEFLRRQTAGPLRASSDDKVRHLANAETLLHCLQATRKRPSPVPWSRLQP